MILAIETATDVCSVAFKNESGEIFEERIQSRGSHSEKLFLFIKALMKVHQFSVDDLDAVLVSEGPGSYTGLRIAASGVKGLLFGSEVPLYGIPTLASFAGAVLKKEPPPSRIHAIIDARRKHVYHQQFSVIDNQLRAESAVNTIEITALEAALEDDDCLVGTGIDRFSKKVRGSIKTHAKKIISATSLIELYQLKANNFTHKISPAQFDPEYYTSKQT